MLQVLIGIDVETDVGSFTPFYNSVAPGVEFLLDLFEEKGVKGTFFWTGHSARHNPETIRLVASSTSEVGAHSLYHETVGDELFPIPGIQPLLPNEVFPRLKLMDEWITEASGVKAVSFRCPRLWGSTAVCNALEELGYVADATYPMYFYREQFVPYHPSKDDWTKKGDMSLVQIPNFADMVMESQDSPLERDRDQWPLFRTEGAEFLMNKISGYEAFCKEKGIEDAVICLYIHPWEFVVVPERFNFGECTVIPDEFITRNCGPVAREQLGLVIDLLLDKGAKFYTAKELADIYK